MSKCNTDKLNYSRAKTRLDLQAYGDEEEAPVGKPDIQCCC